MARHHAQVPGQQALVLVLWEQHQRLRIGVLGKPQPCMAGVSVRDGYTHIRVV